MRFDVLEISPEVVHRLYHPLARVRKSDPKLYDQIRRAASSVPLNIAEGSRRHGKDRLQRFAKLTDRAPYFADASGPTDGAASIVTSS
ncbi:MAG: four helix bundle protein [Planctomycetota bacterium]